MNKNCGIIRGNSDFQGKMDRYGKAGTAWKIEKNIYNQEQMCYGIKVIQEKTVYFRCRRVTYFTKILPRISRKFPYKQPEYLVEILIRGKNTPIWRHVSGKLQ